MLRLTRASAATRTAPAEPPSFSPIPLPHPAASSRGLILSSPALFPTLCSLLSPMTYAEADTLPSSPRPDPPSLLCHRCNTAAFSD